MLIPDDEHIFNGLLIFRTLRTGFPTAKVVVTDNGSAPHIVRLVSEAAKAAGCEFQQNYKPTEHGAWMADVLRKATDPIVFCDSDIVFWAPMEGMDFQAEVLFAGRLIPAFKDGDLCHQARIHTSLMFVPCPQELVATMKQEVPVCWDAVRAFGWRDQHGDVQTWDTCSALYASLPERAYAFTEKELDCYDHLFMGTTSGDLENLGASDAFRMAIEAAHAAAKVDLSSIKGLWRKQVPFVPTFKWSYKSGFFGRYAVSVCRFYLPTQIVHVGVTDLETGSFYYDCIPGSDDSYIDTKFGRVEFVASEGKWINHGMVKRPGGWSKHSSAPNSIGSFFLDGPGGRYEAQGAAWIDEEESTVAPGTAWHWEAISLASGARRAVYEFPDAYHLASDQSFGEVPPGLILKPALPFPTEIVDEWTGVQYQEQFCWVLDGDKVVGHAFAETVLPGWPYERPGILEMYERWAAGDESAAECMRLVALSSQIGDDLVDGELESGGLVKLVRLALRDLPNNAFYAEHKERIDAVIDVALLAWDASETWKSSSIQETRMFAYTWREATALVLATIALLAGGTEHARRVMREIHWYYHTGRVESFAAWEREHGR